MFFFEKKNQKTFVPRSVSLRATHATKIKVFCFFSSEKKAFLLPLAWQWAPVRIPPGGTPCGS
jgi:hypothetical protein